MSKEQEARCVADDLELLLTGHLSEAAFRTKYEKDAESALLRVIWPNLEHYLADSDIREGDATYGAMQKAEMEKLIRLLRTGAPASELSKVCFI